MRMAMDLGLHRALEKLVDSNPLSSNMLSSINEASPDSVGGSSSVRRRTEDQERDLGELVCSSSLL